ncbi:MAG: protein kinase domain-containing protein [Gemmatimonadales bacterium]
MNQSPLSGTLAGRYAIEREIGRGAMATVYLARDLRHDRPVAVKLLRPELARQLGSERFLREIQIAAGLRHPHILPLYDSGEAEDSLYYVMPYLAGGTLRMRLLRERRLPVGEAVVIAREVAEALACAHEAGIVHRDIKPENVLLESGHVAVADFGIARAIGAASVGAFAGLPVGTPGYMSPEQLTAPENIDGRSDLYSLGCTLYEMLAGELPATRPVRQDTGRRTGDRLPSLRLTRPDLPRWLEPILARALAERPADRYPDLRAFAAALASHPLPPQRPRRRRLLALAGAAAGVALAATAWWLLTRSELDRDLHLVLPFRYRPGEVGAAAPLVTSDLTETLLYDALSRWSDIRLVNSMRVRDALVRRGKPVLQLGDGLEVARAAGAGLLIWGEVWARAETTFVRGVLYDVARRGASLREKVRWVTREADVAQEFGHLANYLVLGPDAPSEPESGLGTHSLAAFRHLSSADSAIARWDLEGAKARLREALALDPAFAQARLRLAMISEWSGEPAAAWRPLLATMAPGGLSPADRELVHALDALAAGDYGRACAAYRARLARDTTDFVAWWGLGQCQWNDRLVVPDRGSPSGWRFRSSYRAAFQAYRRALEILPSAYLFFQNSGFDRIRQLLYTEAHWWRWGYSVGPDTAWFMAFPSLSADTLAFVPYPSSDVLEGRRETIPPTHMAAVARNRDQLRELSTIWIRAFPDSATPRVFAAELLERSGLGPGQPASDSALRLLREAGPRTLDPDLRARIGVAEVRVLLKLGDFAAARRAADSLLRAWPSPPTAVAGRLAPVAELLGRPRFASDLVLRSTASPDSRTGAGPEVRLPVGVEQLATVLLAYAAAGVNRDSIEVMERRAEESIVALVPPAQRGSARGAALDEATAFAFLVAGLRPAHRPMPGTGHILELQWRVARGDPAGARRRLAELDRMREDVPPGAIAIHVLFLEASLLVLMGDSVAAVRRLDLALGALPESRLDLLEGFPKPAALVRAMALRASLAAASGQREEALYWAAAVNALWSGAEPAVSGLLNRMDRITERM